MARSFSGTAQFITWSDNAAYDVSGTALSISLWFYLSSTTAERVMIAKGDTATFSHNYFISIFNAGSASFNRPRFFLADGTNSWAVDWNANVTTNTWTHLYAYYDGTNIGIRVGGGTAVTAAGPTALTTNASPLKLGSCANGAGDTLLWNGRLAEVAVYDTVLTADEALSLSRAFAPSLVRPQSLRFYAPLIGRVSPEPDIRNGLTGTVTGATVQVHPRIIYADAPEIGKASTAVQLLAASGTTAFTGAAPLAVDKLLAAAGTTTLTGAAPLAIDKPLTAAATATFTGAAPLAIDKPLAADGTATFTGSADLDVAASGAVLLAAAGATTFTGAASLALDKPLAAAGVTAFTGAAPLVINKPLTAAATATFTGAAPLAINKPLAAAATATFTGAALLVIDKPLAASGTATFTGAAPLAINKLLAAAGTATFTGAAALAIEKPLDAAGTITFTGTAEFSLGDFTPPGARISRALNEATVSVERTGIQVSGRAISHVPPRRNTEARAA